MQKEQFSYLGLLLGSFLFPFLLSFAKGVSFYKKWRPLFLAHIIIAMVFCIWDYVFTYFGVWGFNPNYILGIYLGNLPLEEVLFFVIIPYCCLFIYESLVTHFKMSINFQKSFIFLGIFFSVLSLVFWDKAYTSINSGLLAILLFYLYQKNPAWLSYFVVSFLISLIPFLLVNGILTGMITPAPIVWYNPSGNLGIRIGTIPVEDIAYCFNLLALNAILYEFLKRKKAAL